MDLFACKRLVPTQDNAERQIEQEESLRPDTCIQDPRITTRGGGKVEEADSLIIILCKLFGKRQHEVYLWRGKRKGLHVLM